MRMRRFLGLLSLAIVLVARVPKSAAEKPRSPLAPAAERAAFHLADDELIIELVAAEPDVVSPVAVAWDEDGRMYVAEMRDYPNATTGGVIKRLDDPDANGRYRRATVFADKLAFPNSVLPWSGGVLVTSAPNIWYFKDTDGDGKADEKRLVLTGFGTGNQQLRVNGLTWGLDNWVYGANGRSGGSIRRPTDPAEKAVSINRSDFRFQPDGGAPPQAISGFSQFGLAKDDWNSRFTNWNTIPIRHVVIEDHYLSRNPYLAEASAVATIADPADLRVYSISPAPQTFNREPVTFFNASCGLTIFRGHLLGEKYQGNAFVCEPLTNLVHRRRLKPAGVTFIAERTEQGKEFLASTDPWFHPVNLTTGPDGALYVMDFYRKWVEHPDFVPEKLRGKIDWRVGAEHGRIWRIRKKDAKPEALPRLRNAKSAQLVEMLSHPNGWRRDTAQRLLVERCSRRAIPLLQEAARNLSTPQARVHALWTLDGAGSLDEKTLVQALHDADAHVREQAIRLSESRLGGSKVLTTAVRELATDPDARVRFQCALTIGGMKNEGAVKDLVRIAGSAGDEWTRLAVLTGLGETAWPFLQEFVGTNSNLLLAPNDETARLFTQVGAILGARNREAELAKCFGLLTEEKQTAVSPGWLAILAGLADGLGRTKRPLHALLSNPPASLEKEMKALQHVLRSARAIAQNQNESPARRVLAIHVLMQARPEGVGKLFEDLLQAKHPQAVQSAAARGIGEVGSKAVVARLLEQWGTLTTSTRRELQTALFRSSELASALLDAVEQEKLAAAELDPATQAAFQRFPDPALQKRAAKLLAKGISADRQEVIRRYEAALRLPGDSRRGASLFAKNCLICHQVQGQGHAVGPDLSGVGSRPKEALLNDILDPSREVSGDYLNYVLTTKRGQVLTGLLASETANSVRLRRAEGSEDTVLRSEIEDLRLTGKSLMPEGLEQTLSPQDVADIMEFLQRPSPLPTAGKK